MKNALRYKIARRFSFIKKRELNSSPFSNVNPQTHNVRSVSDVKYTKSSNYFFSVNSVFKILLFLKNILPNYVIY